MKRLPNQQLALKPQDLVVLLKIAIDKDTSFTYALLGKALRMAASQVHASLKRARLARLVTSEGESTVVVRAALREFVLYGARYAFPPISGSLVRGVPTAYAGPSLRDQLLLPNEPVPVWPYAKGSTRGVALYPLYPSVPYAVEQDAQLYEVLSLFDALRMGAARERELASELLKRKLA